MLGDTSAGTCGPYVIDRAVLELPTLSCVNQSDEQRGIRARSLEDLPMVEGVHPVVNLVFDAAKIMVPVVTGFAVLFAGSVGKLWQAGQPIGRSTIARWLTRIAVNSRRAHGPLIGLFRLRYGARDGLSGPQARPRNAFSDTQRMRSDVGQTPCRSWLLDLRCLYWSRCLVLVPHSQEGEVVSRHCTQKLSLVEAVEKRFSRPKPTGKVAQVARNAPSNVRSV